MPRPSYAELGDSCLTAHALELIGQRWTYPVMRELMLGPKRFSDLVASVNGITPAVLSARLKQTSRAGLTETIASAPPMAGTLYALTGWARSLGPVLQDLGRWAQHSPTRPTYVGLTPDAAVQAMTTLAGGRRLVPSLHAEVRLFDVRRDKPLEHPYDVNWTRRGLTVRRGNAVDPDVIIRSDSSAWAHLLFADAPSDLDLAIAGNHDDARRLIHELREDREYQS